MRFGRDKACAAALLSLAATTAAQEAAPQAIALGGARAAEPPSIDGVLDEADWSRAAVIDGFTQVDPLEGAPPTERTEVRVLYDADNLYIGVTCFDSEPEGVIARSMARDASFNSDDRIGITLDTFFDKRNGYFFVVSAAGGKRDGLIEGRSTRWEWDGLWSAATRRNEEGWVAEIAIPMKTLSFDERGTVWGFNVERIISRKNELVRWASPTRDTGLATMSTAGELTELEDLDQGYGITVKPFFTGKIDLNDTELDFEPGVDIFYKLTPSTTAALTINTDFAEAEVDERRVNLTRFPLFFPEKRAFFLEDSGIFEFGGINRSPRPFFSRRIGIVGGEEKDILAGLRLTGREGALRFGVLDVQMQDDDELGHKNLGVIRLKHDVLEESSIGLIATNGDPADRGSNQLLGVDFNFVDTDAAGGSVNADLWAMATHDDPTGEQGENDDPYAFGGRFGWNADPWFVSLFFGEVGHDFNPGLGFVSRPGTREFNARAGYTWRPRDNNWIRSVRTDVGLGSYTTFGNDIQTAELDLPRVTVTTESDDSIFGELNLEREVLDDPFEIVDGVTIPVGSYDNAGWRVGFETSETRWLSLDADYGRRGFYDGTRADTSAGLTFRPNAGLAISGEYTINDIELEDGAFQVETARLRSVFQFSPELSWDNTVQWDNRSEQMGLNSRVRYEFRPGQELFVVYNEGFNVADREFESLGNELVVKVGLTFRF